MSERQGCGITNNSVKIPSSATDGATKTLCIVNVKQLKEAVPAKSPVVIGQQPLKIQNIGIMHYLLPYGIVGEKCTSGKEILQTTHQN